MTSQTDIIILGAGAAGLFCGITAAKRGLKVIVLEKEERAGKKILISGGGRCNFTNINAGPANYISSNPHFVKSALARFPADDFINLVKKHRISFFEKKLGQLFCSQSSKEILDMLLDEFKNAGGQLVCGNQDIEVLKKENGFEVKSSKGIFTAKNLVVATGGLSFPKLGATNFGYKLAKQLGHKIIPTQPGLVPLVFTGKDITFYGEISGISAEVKTSVASIKKSFEESLLFTHNGLSGPAILQISNYWKENEPLIIDWLPQLDATEWLIGLKKSGKKAEIKNVLAAHFPDRLCEKFCTYLKMEGRIADCKDEQLKKWGHSLNNFSFKHPLKRGSYDKAEVTLGGVDTNEVSSQSFESKRTKGLYLIGEVLDVTGWLGGYNFQWAWASGYCCGMAID